MAVIRVAIRDKVGSDFRIEEKTFIQELSEHDMERLARECEKIIRETITNKIQRHGSTGNLAHGFYAHSISGVGIIGWAVGDIDELDTHLKYWNHLDKGSEAIGARWQHFLPLGRFINERWVEDPKGFTFIPSKPIPAYNYIAETISQMDVKISKILSEKF